MEGKEEEEEKEEKETNFQKHRVKLVLKNAPRALIILDVVYKKEENFEAGMHSYLSQQQFIIYK